MAKESTIYKSIKKTVKREFPGCYCLKIHGGLFQESGIPDLLLCVYGHFFGIEVKRPETRNKVSDLQKHHIKRIRLSGGHACVVSNVNEAIDFIKESLKSESRERVKFIKKQIKSARGLSKRSRKRDSKERSLYISRSSGHR